jgi:hypothetical protein
LAVCAGLCFGQLWAGPLTFGAARQAWIRASLRREVACKAVDLDCLLDGKPSAYVHVHSAAMAALVTGAGPLKADVCPETLAWDVGRLCGLQREVRWMVTATTMLATATHHLRATRNGRDVQALAGIAELLAGETRDADQVCSRRVRCVFAHVCMSSMSTVTLQDTRPSGALGYHMQHEGGVPPARMLKTDARSQTMHVRDTAGRWALSSLKDSMCCSRPPSRR